jgi:peptidoglycan/LPS O-acetylase OafA/YrhL
MASGSAPHPHGSRVGPVDALRCFAMTAVVAQHNGLLPFGWTGVWLFFVISGYVVTLAVVGRQSGLPARQGLADFFRRRALRIVPVYYAYVGIGLLVCLATGAGVNMIAVGSLLGFFNNVAMSLGHGELVSWPVGHLWTISIEMQFYAVYGVLLFLVSRRTVVVLLLFALLASPILRLAASFLVAYLGWDSEASAYAIYSGSFLHTDSFATGALLALGGQKEVLGRIARPLAAAGGVILAVYASVYVSLNYAAGERGVDMFRNVISGIAWGQYREVFLYTAMAAASGGLVALAATRDPLINWLLKPRLLQRIGEVSYGAYVYHPLAIMVTSLLLAAFFQPEEWSIGWKAVRFLASYMLTVAAAELSFRCFESRFTSRRGHAMPRFRADPLPAKGAT